MIEAWRAGTGHHIYEGYGQTETVLLAGPSATPWKPGSMGPAPPGHVLVVGDDGQKLLGAPRAISRSVSRGAPGEGMFAGYWRNDEATAKCHRGDWYVTGDRAAMDEDGYLWFVGRPTT